MNRLALVVLVAACGEGDKRAAPAVAPPPKETITVELAGCAPAVPAPVDPRRQIVPGGPGVRTVPRALISNPIVTGTFDKDVVRRILRRHLVKFQRCFEDQLAQDPRLTGGIAEALFAIQPSGHVASPTVRGIDDRVDKCFADALTAVAFPAPFDGNQSQVSLQIEIRYNDPAAPAPPPRPTKVVREWTPFASVDAPTAPAVRVEAVAKAVTASLPAIEKCFDGAKGKVRAMLSLDSAGRVEQLRIGGLGDSTSERCVETALAGVGVDQGMPVEIACDFTRGGEAPLRVSPDAGYTVIELTAHEARNGSTVRMLPKRGDPARIITALGTSSSALVLAEPDAPSHGFDYALWWAPAGTTLVAVKASGGAPIFLGMGDSRAQREPAQKRVVELRTDRGRMRACIPGEQLDASAPLLDPKQMDAVMSVVKSVCAREACEPTIVVGTSGDFVAKDLVATTSAARRAGFARLSIGGPACD